MAIAPRDDDGRIFAAVEQHAGAADLPHGPLFGVTDHGILTTLFADAGVADVTIEALPTAWAMPSIVPLLAAFGSWAHRVHGQRLPSWQLSSSSSL